MLPKNFLVLLLVTSAVFCADNGDYIVRKVRFSGNESIKERELTNLLHLKEPYLLSTSKFDQRILKLDAIIVRNYYISKGFLGVTVKDSFSVNTENGVDIFFRIREGRQVILGDIDVKGATVLTGRTVSRILELTPGKPYNPLGLNTRMALVEEELARYSKLFTTINVYETEGDTVDVLLQIEEGPDISINSVRINGNDDIDTTYITRELKFKPGDLYKQGIIDESEKRIIESGQFSFVNINPVPVSGSKDQVDLAIELRKFKPREIISEGGFYPYRINETADELRSIGGTIEWKNRNLFNSLKRFSLTTGANLPIIDNLSDIQYFKFTGSMTLSSQWFLGYRLPTSLSAYYETYSDPLTDDHLRIQKYGTTLEYEHRFSYVSYITTGLQWEKFDQLESSDIEIEDRTINFDIHWDATDSPLNPTKGSLFTFNLSSTGWLLGGNRDFLKIDIGLSTYSRLFRQVVLAGRVKYGFMYGWQDNYSDPLYDLFYLGGSTTLRGWENFRFLEGGGDPLGKPYRVLTNWELRIPLVWRLGMEIFLDGGNLAGSFQALTVNNILWDAGIGLVVQSPLGPVRLDYAAQLADTRNSMVLLGVLYAF